jgi:hypothetical protein
VLLAAALGFVLIASACSSSPGTGGAGGAGGGTGGAGCTTFQNSGESVTLEPGTGDAPTPLGGAIEVGTYVLTRAQSYPPESAIPRHATATLSISDTNSFMAGTNDDYPNGFSAQVALTAAGTQLTFTYLCRTPTPTPPPSTTGYTATPTELLLMTLPTPGIVETFTKR